MTGGTPLNLVLKKMLELFLKMFTFSKKYYNFNIEKKTAKLIQKRKLQAANLTDDWKLTIWTISIRKQTSKNFLKNVSKLPSKFLKDIICKIKQYLNYIYWLYKSKYSSSPKMILKMVWNQYFINTFQIN